MTMFMKENEKILKGNIASTWKLYKNIGSLVGCVEWWSDDGGVTNDSGGKVGDG